MLFQSIGLKLDFIIPIVTFVDDYTHILSYEKKNNKNLIIVPNP